MSQGKRVDLTGRRFGRLTVLRREGHLYKYHVAWLCVCDCGEEMLKTTDQLNRGIGCRRCSKVSSQIGVKYNLLKTIGPSTKRDSSGKRLWEFECDCGETCFYRPHEVTRGRVKSCGHLLKIIQQDSANLTPGSLRHGHSGRAKTGTYISWQAMKSRCLYEKDVSFARYGGRGITICDRWMHFDEFLADMGERPDWADGGIDRIDSDGNYEPDNCRWATQQQQQNKRPRTTKAPAEAGA